MAAGYACQWGDDNHGASIIITWLGNGATVTLCPEHFSPALINILAVDLGVNPDRFYDGVKRLLDREAKRQADEEGKDSTADDGPDGAPDDAESTHDGDAEKFWPGMGSSDPTYNDADMADVP